MPTEHIPKEPDPSAIERWALRWAERLRETTWTPHGRASVDDLTRSLVRELVWVMTASHPDQSDARRVAQTLLDAGYTGPRVLPASLRTFQRYAASAVPGVAPRLLAMVEDWFTAAYVAGRTTAAITAQETSRRAEVDFRTGAERQLRDERRLLEAVFAHVPAALCLADLNGMAIRVNEAFTRLTGRDAETCTTVKLTEFLRPSDVPGVWRDFQRVISKELPDATRHVCYRHRDGHDVAAEIAITLLPPEASSTRYALLHISDVSQRTVLRQILGREVGRDPTTFLLNRLGFHRRLTHACRESDDKLAVFYVRLKDLARIDALYGEDHGRRLLLTVADHLQRALGGRSDVIASVERDTFGILVHLASRRDIRRIADELHAAVRDGPRIEGHSISPVCGIGVAERAAATPDADRLMAAAHDAVSRTEPRGSGRTVVHVPDSSRQRRTRLTADLSAALVRDELELAFEPVVSLAEHRLRGLVAHARWRHPGQPDSPLMLPQFLRQVTDADPSVWPRLRAWLYTAACTRLQQRSTRTGEDLFVCLPLTAGQPYAPDVLADAATALSASGLPPHALHLHISQAELHEHAEDLIDDLQIFAAEGVHLVLTGLGADPVDLAAIRDLPWRGITVHPHALPAELAEPDDPSAPAPDNPVDPVPDTLIRMARSLNLTTTADLVETPRQARYLRRLGCELATGPYAEVRGPADAD